VRFPIYFILATDLGDRLVRCSDYNKGKQLVYIMSVYDTCVGKIRKGGDEDMVCQCVHMDALVAYYT